MRPVPASMLPWPREQLAAGDADVGLGAWAGDIPRLINESAMPTMSVPRPTREAAFR